MNALVNNGDSVVLAGATGPSLGEAEFAFLREFVPVSYTHLTLPTKLL